MPGVKWIGFYDNHDIRIQGYLRQSLKSSLFNSNWKLPMSATYLPKQFQKAFTKTIIKSFGSIVSNKHKPNHCYYNFLHFCTNFSISNSDYIFVSIMAEDACLYVCLFLLHLYFDVCKHCFFIRYCAYLIESPCKICKMYLAAGEHTYNFVVEPR